MIKRWLLLGSLFALGAQAAQPVSPEETLARLGDALSANSYEGVVVYVRDGQLDAVRVRHSAGSGQDLLERLTGPELPLVRQAGSAQLGGSAGMEFSSPPADIAAKLAAGDHYRFEQVAEDRVAGRKTDVLDLRAGDALRFSRRLWVDRDTGLLLRSAVFAGDGSLVEQWMFSSLEIGPAMPSAPAPGALTQVRAPSASDIPRTRLQVVDLPPGFVLVAAAVDGDHEHLVYSDGLARVSVFAQPLEDRAAVLSGHQRRGALSVFGRLYRGLQVVVVGEVPAATAERFAQSVDALRGG